MDASFNQAGRQGQSSRTPATQSAYQVNVSRKKTRKWVEAKVQSYDGDDWGAPEDEEDEDEEDEDGSPERKETPPILRPGGGQRLPSESRFGGGGRFISADESASQDSSISSSGRARLQQPPATLPTTRGPAEVTSPVVSGPGHIVSPQPTAPFRGQHQTTAPQITAGGDGALEAPPTPKLVRPSDIYRQTEIEKVNQSQSADEPRPRADSVEESSEVDRRMSVSPQLPNMARISGFGVDMFSDRFAEKLTASEPTVEEGSEPSSKSHTPAAKETDVVSSVQASSSQPVQSEEVSSEQSKAKEADQATAGRSDDLPSPEQQRPSLPGGWVTETLSIRQESGRDTPEQAPQDKEGEGEALPTFDQHEANISDFLRSSTALSGQDPKSTSQKDFQPGSGPRSLPPLRTSSPREPQAIPLPMSSQETPSHIGSRDVTPTEPLNPRKPDYSPYTPSEYGISPLQKVNTIDTVTSSPIKESDVLSAEILKTLSPSGLSSSNPKLADNWTSLSPGNQGKGQQSSYTLDGHDDSWTNTYDKKDATGKKASSNPHHDVSTPDRPSAPVIQHQGASQEHSTMSPGIILSPISSGQKELRHRFSWEAPDSPDPLKTPEPMTIVSPESTTAPSINQPTQLPSVVSNEDPRSPDSTGLANQATSPTIMIVSDKGISHQVSNASTAQPTGQPLPEPPSPLSDTSDRNQFQKPLSSIVETVATESTSRRASVGGDHATPTPSVGPTAPDLSKGKPILTFHEIMNLSTPQERAQKFEETRGSFAAMDSGLDNWVSMMISKPEHANATALYSGTEVSASRPTTQASSNTGPIPSGQPYYQQYLNASSQNSASASSARARLAGLQAQAQAAAGSAFGHSGNQVANQVGHKSKELMHSAGKMGKGLFSKGKSKLRGTGDKDETSPPPPVQRLPKLNKNDRRASWTLGFGARSRDGTAEQPTIETFTSPMSPFPPKIDEPARLSPLINQDSSTDTGFLWSSYQGGTETHTSEGQKPKLSPLDTGNVTKPFEAPFGVRRGRDPTPVAQVQPISDDWVVVPHTDSVPIISKPQIVPKPKPIAVHEDSGIGLPLQPAPEPKRNSSFKGLPPIRRSSTFGLTTKATAKRASERFSMIDDDEDLITEDPGDIAPDDKGESSIQAEFSVPLIAPLDNATLKSLGHDSNATLIGQESTGRTGRTSISQKEPIRWSLSGSPLQADTSSPQGSSPMRQNQLNSPNPIERQPPSGWQLEESHLSEPLHQVSRRRAGTASSDQRFDYGFDKETGGPMSPISPASPIQGLGNGPPGRGRNSIIPPSSAQRYPELFRPMGSPLQQQGGFSDEPVPGKYQTRGSIDGLALSGPQIKEQEPGRNISVSGGVFKGIGDRIRTASRERRGSVTADEARHDEATSGIAQEEAGESKKRRSIFLPALRARASLDVDSRGQENVAHPLSRESTQPLDTSEKKRSFLGATADKISATQHKFVTGGLPRLSTSNMTRNSGADGTVGPMSPPMGPSKKRLSGFADKAAGLFHRPGQEKSDVPYSNRSSVNDVSQDGAISQMALNPPPKGRGRSGTTESLGMAPPPRVGTDSPERRGRRGSISGMFTGILGRRAESRTREQDVSMVQMPTDLSLKERGRTDDGGPRSSRTFSQQLEREPRSSPLAQEFSIHSGSPLVRPPDGQWLKGPPAVAEFAQRTGSPKSSISDGIKDPIPSSTTYSLGHDAKAVHDDATKPSNSSPDLLANFGGEIGPSPPPKESQIGKSLPNSIGGPSKILALNNAPRTLGKRQPSSQASAVPSIQSVSPPAERNPSSIPLRSQDQSRSAGHAPQGAQPVGSRGHSRTQSRGSPAPPQEPAWRPSGDFAPSSQAQQQGYGPSGHRKQLSASDASQGPDGRWPSPQPSAMSGDSMRQNLKPPARGQSPGHGSFASDGTPKSGWKGWKSKVSNQLAQMSTQGGQDPERPKKQGWNTRVSSQRSQVTAQASQDKPGKWSNSSAGDKLFGAFKRGSKPAEPKGPPVPPKSPHHVGQEQQGQQQLRQPPPQDNQLIAPFPGQPPYVQYQISQMPPGNLPAGAQYYVQHPHWAQAPLSGQPPLASTQQFWQMAANHSNQPQQQPGQSMPRQTEHQYGQVSIPRSYTHAAGANLAPRYYGGQLSMPPGQQSHSVPVSHISQQGYYPQGQPGQVPPQATQLRHALTLPIQQNQSLENKRVSAVSNDAGTPDSHKDFILPIQGADTIGARAYQPVPTTLAGNSVASRPGAIRLDSVASDGAHSVESGAMGMYAPRQQGRSGVSPQQQQLHPQISKNSINGMLDISRGVSPAGGTTSVVSPPKSVSPDAGNGNPGRGREDSEDLYDATPRLLQTEQTGWSNQVSEVSKSSTGDSCKDIPVETKRVELEDTADARLRTLRLSAQEEKIFYDPEGDVPKMSATSYPGQEWNPYGEPEFADWRDD